MDICDWSSTIGTGFTAKNVISYPTECEKEQMAKDYLSHIETLRHFSIS